MLKQFINSGSAFFNIKGCKRKIYAIPIIGVVFFALFFGAAAESVSKSLDPENKETHTEYAAYNMLPNIAFSDTSDSLHKPTLTISQPEVGTITRIDSIAVSGDVFPPARSTEITVNGDITAVDPLGKFSTTVHLFEGNNGITIIATDRSGSVDEVTRNVILDTIPPEVSISFPQDSSFTNQQDLTITGTVSEALSVFTINGDSAEVDQNNNFSVNVTVTEEENVFTFHAIDLAGNSTTEELTIIGDFEAPELNVSVAYGDPDDPEIEIVEVNDSDTLTTSLPEVYITGEAIDEISNVEGAINQVTILDGQEDSVLTFSEPVELEEGLNAIEVLAYDQAGNISTVEVFIIRSVQTQFPSITIHSPSDNFETFNGSVQISGTVADITESILLRINDEPVSVSQDGEFSHKVYLFPGKNYFSLKAVNADGEEAVQSLAVIRNHDTTIPPDPVTVAPEVDQTVVTTMSASTEFLYKGENAVQRGVEEETIEPQRTSVVKGKVLDNSGTPLSGVLITILDHPEYGYTLSRDDGEFDMAVNGGGHLTVNYEKENYLPAQRKVKTPWQDYAVVDSVMLIQLDPNVTTINFTDSVEVARGSVVSDADGSRQATLLFEQGTTASMVLPDGTIQTLNSLDVRATEYTVGENGPASMPALLPPASGYTYAAEFSADEALLAGATEVRFDKPVAFYLENFIGFPVGTPVPAGYYDRELGQWIASKNGLVIEIMSITDGLAEIDMDGDGIAEPVDTLEAAGIDTTERQQLAVLYSAGETLWRTEITHFTPWDCNFPYGPPEDAIFPEQPQWADNLTDNDKSDCKSGSIISVENQTLGEGVDITGAPCGLYYTSATAPGFAKEIPIKVSGSSLPGSTQEIRLNVRVAGITFDTTFTPQANLTYNFRWGGKDAYGRIVQGSQKATISVGYEYETVYYTPDAWENAFGRYGRVDGQEITGTRTTATILMWQSWTTTVGHLKQEDFGGWSPGIHHQYDFTGTKRSLYKGNGSIRSAESVTNIVKEEWDAHQVNIAVNQIADIAVGPDGSIYYNDGDDRIMRIHPDGTPETVTELLPRSVNITRYKIDVSDNGTVYYTDTTRDRIYKVRANGESELIAGTGSPGACGYPGDDGGPALEAVLCGVMDIAVDSDGGVYIADNRGNVVRKIDSDGIISTVAGTGFNGFRRPGGPALNVHLSSISGIDIGPDGSIYITESGRLIRRITPDGILTTVAGNGQPVYPVDYNDDLGNDGPATSAQLFHAEDVTVSQDGSIYIADYNANQIRKVTTDGIIYRLAGLYGGDPSQAGFNFNNGPGPGTQLNKPRRIAVGPNGGVYFSEANKTTVRVVDIGPDYFDGGEIVIASKDGSQIYEFDALGKHQKTRDALTGNTLFEFDYDTTGLLSKIIDIDGMETTVERNPDGTPTAFVAPFGQRTELEIGPDGYLAAITNPAGEATRFTYTDGGLLTGMITPRGDSTFYTYDALGYFRRADYPNGGFTELSKADVTNGFEIATSSAEGSNQVNQLQQGVDGSLTFTSTEEHGLSTTREYGDDGSTIVTTPDSTVIVTKTKPDPRFGMQAPITDELRVSTPSGLESVFSQDRTITQITGDKVTGMTDTFVFNGKVTTSTFDGNQNLYTTTSPEGRQTYSYTDSLDRVIQTVTPGIDPVNYTYNSDGFLTESEQGGRKATFSYNDEGYLETVKDPLGRMETTYYDSVGRVTTQVLPNGEEILYSYDANGNLSSITPPGKPAHTFEYTEVNLTESYTPPSVPDSAGDIAYLYDMDKKLLSTVFSDSTSIGIVYDTTVTGSSRPMEINYDQGSMSFTYDSTSGNLTSVASSDSVVTSYSYDGSLTTQLATQGVVNGTIDYSYNNDFQVISQSINGANTVGFTYDDDGLLTEAGQLAMSYDPQNGLLTGTTLGNFSGSYSYNAFGELTGTTHDYNSSDLFDRSFTRDSLGRITSITETIEGETTLYEYAYNEIGYLVKVKEDGVITAKYEYDANGNRTAYITPSDTVTATYDDQDRMLTYGDARYSYGPRGDLQRKIEGTDTTNYNYDNVGNLRSIILPDDSSIEYIIDGQNRRVGKKVNGAVTKRWLYAGGLLPIAELDSTGAVEKRYTPGAIIKNDTTYRVIRDHLGSVRLVINSENGEVVQRIDYDEYGNITYLENPDEFTDIGFAGGFYDSDTGLIRFGARDYDPETGRWTAKDPILFAGGTSNLYEYALNDPVNNKDPFGLQSLSDSLANSYYDVGLGAGASTAVIDQYQNHLGRQYAQYYRSPTAQSLPSARMTTSNIRLLKIGKNFGAGVGVFCTALGVAADSQNPNVSNARTSYRAGVGVLSTVVAYYNPILGAGVQLTGTGLEYGYDIGTTFTNAIVEILVAAENALKVGNTSWIPY